MQNREFERNMITNLFSSESGWIERNLPGKVKAAHIHRASPMINSRITLIGGRENSSSIIFNNPLYWIVE
jgi:hypothetical protein